MISRTYVTTVVVQADADRQPTFREALGNAVADQLRKTCRATSGESFMVTLEDMSAHLEDLE